MQSQLSRILLSAETPKLDEQVAVADEHGAYSELMDAIDEVISEPPAEGDAGSPGGESVSGRGS
jgi:hypothetical protein